MENKQINLGIEPIFDALQKTIMHSSKVGPYSRQKVLNEFNEFYEPKPFGVKKTYPRNFPIVYAAARTEKLMFFRILKDAVDFLDIPQRYSGYGRPSADLKDILKCLCIQAYCGLSHWRIESELRIVRELGVIDNIYRKSALSKYLNKTEITNWLHKIYQTIAVPMATIELGMIGADATGMSVQYCRRRWVEVREDHKQHKDYKKLHVLSGTKSLMVYSARVTDGRIHESPQLKYLLKDIKGKFSFKEFTADAGYLSRENADLVADAGMTPYIMPRKNIKSAYNKGTKGNWGKMIRLWKYYPDLFKYHYHRRSLVESTFSSIKRKYGYEVRSKNETGQINEILTKIVCLNASILSEAMLEFKLNPAFMDT